MLRTLDLSLDFAFANDSLFKNRASTEKSAHKKTEEVGLWCKQKKQKVKSLAKCFLSLNDPTYLGQTFSRSNTVLGNHQTKDTPIIIQTRPFLAYWGLNLCKFCQSELLPPAIWGRQRHFGQSSTFQIGKNPLSWHPKSGNSPEWFGMLLGEEAPVGSGGEGGEEVLQNGLPEVTPITCASGSLADI